MSRPSRRVVNEELGLREATKGSGVANIEASSESSEGTMFTAEEMLLFMGEECLRTCAEVSLGIDKGYHVASDTSASRLPRMPTSKPLNPPARS